jgi:hypothetical protein
MSNFMFLSGNSKFLYTWQLLDPAGSHPYPGMEITYHPNKHNI